jgi:hypothetical protein
MFQQSLSYLLSDNVMFGDQALNLQMTYEDVI